MARDSPFLTQTKPAYCEGPVVTVGVRVMVGETLGVGVRVSVGVTVGVGVIVLVDVGVGETVS